MATLLRLMSDNLSGSAINPIMHDFLFVFKSSGIFCSKTNGIFTGSQQTENNQTNP